MSFFERASYIRAIFVLLPFGIASFYYGIDGLLESESNLIRIEGIIHKARVDNAYSDLIDSYETAFKIKLKGIEQTYRTFITNDIESLEASLSEGDKVTIWTRKNSLDIVKLKRFNEILIPFNPTNIIDFLFLAIGIIYTFLSAVYIIKHPEDLWGGDKEKMKKWLGNSRRDRFYR